VDAFAVFGGEVLELRWLAGWRAVAATRLPASRAARARARPRPREEPVMNQVCSIPASTTLQGPWRISSRVGIQLVEQPAPGFAQEPKPGCRCLSMAVKWSAEELDSAASKLRSMYRCSMCHKHCRIPCKLTAAEFRQMERAMTEAAARSQEVEASDERG
jgi:hypothetical protein